MTKPTTHAVTRNRAAVMAELRRLMPRMGEQRKPLPFGLGTIDSHLPDGGLACGALHEVVPAAESCIAAAFGFLAAVLARISFPPPERGRSTTKGRRVGVSAHTDPSPDCLRQHSRCEASASLRTAAEGRLCPPLSGEGHNLPIVLVMPTYGLRPYRPHGRLHGHGLSALGLDPARLILVETAHRKETLWAMEEAVRSAAPAAVVGVIDTLDLKLSQRLHLAATDAGLPVFLLRPAPPTLPSPASGGGWGGGSAAATRWRIGPAPAARDRFGLVTQPRWHLQLERCRNGRPGQWVVEYDHVAHRFSLAAALADFSRARGAGETSIRQAS
jgi:protein ImuA